MARVWTEAQSAAIATKDKTLLVSAAAGSGKTAALIERIIRMITDKNEPADISRMLIVTFTKAAAGELRERIHTALTKAIAEEPGNRYLQKQMTLLESAKICTIHSFCLDLIRANFQRLSLSPSFRVADEAEQALLYRSVMNDLIDLTYESEKDPYAKDSGMGFSEFADNFAMSRDDKNLCDVFISLYKKLSSYPEGVEILNESAKTLKQSSEREFFETPYGRVISERLISMLSYYQKAYKDALEHFDMPDAPTIKYLDSYKNDLDAISALLCAIKEGKYEKARAAAHAYSPVKLASVKLELLDNDDLLYRALRDDFSKKGIKKIAADYFSLSEADIKEDLLKTSSLCAYLYGFMSDFEKNIESEKKRRGICGFSDLERYALDLLYKNGEKGDLAHSVAEGYDYVYIDEYQDVNAVQDMIFRAVSRPDNRFMVGDIKQSIYGFRGAEPSIFSGYRAAFPDLFSHTPVGDVATIFMSDNFRCDENVVKFVNEMSQFTMRYSSINYLPEDDLVFKKAENTGAHKVKFTIWESDAKSSDDEDDDSYDPDITTEAEGVAREIKRLISSEKKNDGEPIRPSDVAILLRSVKRSGPAFVKALAREGIAAYGNTEENDFFDSPEILLMLSLLNTIDNPRRDIYLAGALRSPLYGFTMDDLVAIKECDDGKMSLFDMLLVYTEQNDFAKGRYFLEKLEKYRSMAEGMSVDKLIWSLYRDTCALSLLSRDKDGRISKTRRDNLMFLYEYARSFEASSYKGLYNFIRYINSLIEEESTVEGAAPECSADAVRIMTIHQSKGLEMPVCFVSDIGKSFNERDVSESLLFDYSLGVATKLRDGTGFARYNTLARTALAFKMSEKRNEEYMRVLYVALTRARERLYVTAKAAKNSIEKILAASKLRAKYPSEYTVGSAKSFLEWALSALGTEGSDYFDFEIVTDTENAAFAEEAPTTKEECATDAERVRSLYDEMRAKLDFVYPYADVPKIPAKLSVSRLYPDLLESEVTEASAPISEMRTSPAFVSGGFTALSAEKGTATHVFMQFCDFEYLTSHGVREELARLVEKRFISKEVASLVNVKQLEAFAKSEFFDRMKRAKELRREFRFNLEFDADMFARSEETKQKLLGEKVLVQGVIDCFFEEANGDIILCDYKTDYLTPEELSNRALAEKKLAERHSEQLGYYKKAILAMCGKEVAHTYIYSLPLGDVIEL